MQVLEELEYFCNIKNPVGALLLTGDWGCGKTYLVDHELRERLKDSHVILKISLFGIDSIEKINATIKKSWVESAFGIASKVPKVVKDAAKITKELSKSFADKGDAVAGIAGGVLAFDISELIKVKNTIGEKKVVLAFDDIERSRLDTTDILGVINEYCENQHFNVIVIANEEKLPIEGEAEIRYKEIKEKVIQRTLNYSPDYKKIIDSIIESYDTSIEYRGFLRNHKEGLQALFEGKNLDGEIIDNSINEDQENLKPKCNHSLRSLKCGIQDFERIYKILSDKKVNHIEKWLYSFICLIMANKAENYKINDNYEWGELLSEIETLYPTFFDWKYMPFQIGQWIINGSWLENDIISEIEKHSNGNHSNDFKGKIICYYDLQQIDDDILKEEFTAALKLAYKGELALFYYSTFISNIASLRKLKPDLVEIIDWNAFYDGISTKMENMLKTEKNDFTPTLIKNTESWMDEEKKAYDMLTDSNINTRVLFEQNKREFISLMKQDFYEAFNFCKTNILDDFDEQMAMASINAFAEASNLDKSYYHMEFSSVIEGILNSAEYAENKDADKGNGLSKALEKLELLKDKYSDKPIALSHTERMIETVTGFKNS